MINNFGQTPTQLLKRPHPKRKTLKEIEAGRPLVINQLESSTFSLIGMLMCKLSGKVSFGQIACQVVFAILSIKVCPKCAKLIIKSNVFCCDFTILHTLSRDISRTEVKQTIMFQMLDPRISPIIRSCHTFEITLDNTKS